MIAHILGANPNNRAGVRAVAHSALRHRILMNFEGEAEGMKTDQLIDAVLKEIAEAKPGASDKSAKSKGAVVGAA